MTVLIILAMKTLINLPDTSATISIPKRMKRRHTDSQKNSIL